MLLRSLAAFLLCTLLIGACRTGTTGPILPRTGAWRMALGLHDSLAGRDRTVPFLFDLQHDSGGWRMHIHNGVENIAVDEISLQGDSIRIRMPLYDSEFLGVVKNDSTITGDWHNYLRGPKYRMPFTAMAGPAPRFAATPVSGKLGNGNWEVHFGETGDSAHACAAIGIFKEAEGRVTGTFATETGDYRFLDGVVSQDSLYLSSFNGTQAFLFAAALRNDSLIGRFWSGIHHQEPWRARLNADFILRNEDSLTTLHEGYAMVDFHFPNVDGGELSPKAPEHHNNVVLVQILGSWCPNCADETVLLNDLFDRHHAEGLDVLGVAFERHTEHDKAIAGLQRFRKRLHVHYPMAYAGTADGQVCDKLPFLDHFMGYPTCIFIGRDGLVRRIHTGFYGPGTGEERYAAYKRDLERFVTALLAEEPPALADRKP